jgi:hypothetical protein
MFSTASSGFFEGFHLIFDSREGMFADPYDQRASDACRLHFNLQRRGVYLPLSLLLRQR